MTAAIFHAGGSAAPASAAAAALSMLPWGQLSRSRRHATSTPPLPGNGTKTTPQKTAGEPAWTRKPQKSCETPAHYRVPPPLQATPALHCPAVACATSACMPLQRLASAAAHRAPPRDGPRGRPPDSAAARKPLRPPRNQRPGRHSHTPPPATVSSCSHSSSAVPRSRRCGISVIQALGVWA